MRRMQSLTGLLGMMLALAGCSPLGPHLKPPKPVEEFRTPPDDPRYQQPPQYPGHLLHQERPRDTFDPDNPATRQPLGRTPGSP